MEWIARRKNEAWDGLKEGGMKRDRRIMEEYREYDENKAIKGQTGQTDEMASDVINRLHKPFMPVTTDVVCTMVLVAADKHSLKDPMPTWLLKTCIDLLAPYIASLFNLSFSSGIVPTSYKDAYVIPRLTKPTLPCCDLSSYRPISNRPFLSKLLERVVSVQLTDYLSSAGLLPVVTG